MPAGLHRSQHCVIDVSEEPSLPQIALNSLCCIIALFPYIAPPTPKQHRHHHQTQQSNLEMHINIVNKMRNSGLCGARALSCFQGNYSFILEILIAILAKLTNNRLLLHSGRLFDSSHFIFTLARQLLIR